MAPVSQDDCDSQTIVHDRVPSRDVAQRDWSSIPPFTVI
jgi:hypothetical protein